MLGFRRWSMSAMVLVTACGFDSGGVPGSNPSGASIGSNETSTTNDDDDDDDDDGSTAGTSASTTKDPSTSATTLPDPDSGMTADPSTTASTTNATDGESSGPMIAETGDVSQGSLDSAPPMDTGAMESSSGMTDDGGVVPPDAPYYGDCSVDMDCGPGGDCANVQVIDGPDADVCLLPCGENQVCPPPDDGNAIPLCNVNGWCVLACNNGEDCPEGMACYVFNWDQADEYRRCLWSQG